MRYLAIDLGQKRVGLAISDAGQSMAFPLVVLEAGPGLISRIAEIVRSEKAGFIVIGLPLNMDGSEGPRAKASREFAVQLTKAVSVPITLFDERLSSAEADWKLAGSDLTRDDRKKRQDAIAAAVFLQAFLEQQKDIMNKPRIMILQSAMETAQKAVMHFCERVQDAIEKRGVCYCALSGGSSPKMFFELLVRETLDWQRIHFFWADERCVEPDHPDSNYSMAQISLLSQVPVPSSQVHRIWGELPPAEAADQYQNTIRSVMKLQAGQWPFLDVVLLGLGADGHTASLLAGTDVVDNQYDIAAAVFSQTMPHTRVTLTAPALTAARSLLFIITGSSKQEILREILIPPLRPWQYPVHALWSAVDKMTWFVDAQAAVLMHSVH
ncbi:MAG: 6-phosphogluconolactonase [Sedimentisphaerales bacterium]|nr:6-phosphogluconolactonase [Sedimentisphaerales bacterium]